MHITIKVDLYLRWPTTENMKHCETVKVAENQVKISSQHKKH